MSITTQTPAGGVVNTLQPGASDVPVESGLDRLRRWALGCAWALKPPRTRDVPPLLFLLLRHYLGSTAPNGELPDPERAKGSGIAGICNDLETDTLVEAYKIGLFPFCHVGPEKWLAPRERMTLLPENFEMEKNLRRRLRNDHFRVTFDQDFNGVMLGCAELRQGRTPLTWITPRIIEAYGRLFDEGHAHSVEVWDDEGRLVGGAYGVSVGGLFFTESQFNRARDAAKVGFAVLNCHLQHWGYLLNDGKYFTPHLARVGFRLIPRRKFNRLLAKGRKLPGRPGRWSVDQSLDVGNWEPSTKTVPRRG